VEVIDVDDYLLAGLMGLSGNIAGYDNKYNTFKIKIEGHLSSYPFKPNQLKKL